MIRRGQHVTICDKPWSTIGGDPYPMPEWAGLPGVVLDGPDPDGDFEVRLDETHGRGVTDVYVHGACLRVPFEHLDAQAASDAVRAVEDAIDAHLNWTYQEFDGEQGPAVVRALLELGWTPPPTP